MCTVHRSAPTSLTAHSPPSPGRPCCPALSPSGRTPPPRSEGSFSGHSGPFGPLFSLNLAYHRPTDSCDRSAGRLAARTCGGRAGGRRPRESSTRRPQQPKHQWRERGGGSNLITVPKVPLDAICDRRVDSCDSSSPPAPRRRPVVSCADEVLARVHAPERERRSLQLLP